MNLRVNDHIVHVYDYVYKILILEISAFQGGAIPIQRLNPSFRFISVKLARLFKFENVCLKCM